MNPTKIDNPDIHMTVDVTIEALLEHLTSITGGSFQVVEQIEKVLELPEPMVPWIHVMKVRDPQFPVSLSIYGVYFSLSDCINLSSLLGFDLVTDYDSNLRQHEWQLIKTDGTIEVIVLEL